MTRRITIVLGLSTTDVHCGDCPGLTGHGIHRGCSVFGDGFHPAFLASRGPRDEPEEVWERSESCIEAEFR